MFVLQFYRWEPEGLTKEKPELRTLTPRTGGNFRLRYVQCCHSDSIGNIYFLLIMFV